MSTKSDIYWGNDSRLRVYEETNQAVTKWGKFRGFDLILIFEFECIINFELKDENFILHIDGFEPLTFWNDPIRVFQLDKDDGLLIELEGGHTTTEKVKAHFTIK